MAYEVRVAENEVLAPVRVRLVPSQQASQENIKAENDAGVAIGSGGEDSR